MNITLYSNVKDLADITIKCAAIRQHIWNKAIVVAPSKAGKAKLVSFIAAHRELGENMPRTSFGEYGTQYDDCVEN